MAEVPIGVRHRSQDLMPECPSGLSIPCQVDIDAGCANAEQSVRSCLELRCSLYSVRHATRVDPMIALPDE
jgi:hypothetical protein